MNESLEKKFERMKLTNKLKKKNIDLKKWRKKKMKKKMEKKKWKNGKKKKNEMRVDDKGKKHINYLINMCIYYWLIGWLIFFLNSLNF